MDAGRKPRGDWLRRLLVAVDDSAQSARVLMHAVHLARGVGAHVTVLHVAVAPPTRSSLDRSRRQAVLDEAAARASGEQILEAARRLAGGFVPLTTELRFGEPADVIATRAGEIGADLVVVGCRGLSAIDRLLVGSVSSTLARRTPCSVLISREPAEAAVAAGAAVDPVDQLRPMPPPFELAEAPGSLASTRPPTAARPSREVAPGAPLAPVARGDPPIRDHAPLAEVVAAVWVLTALAGILAGTAFAKYAQAWAQSAVHPGAAIGVAVVLAAVLLGLVAVGRYLAPASVGRGPSTLLGSLGAFLVAALGWSALSVIGFAGWEFPPARP